MKKIRIKDLPYFETIVSVSKIVNKEISLSSRYGIHIITTPKPLKGLKEGDKLRLVKLINAKALKKVNGNIFAVRPSGYSLQEWKQGGDYNIRKDGEIVSKYITYEKAYLNSTIHGQ